MNLNNIQYNNLEVYINSVYNGGAYKYLLDKVYYENKSVLVLDIRDYKNSINYKLITTSGEIDGIVNNIKVLIDQFHIQKITINHLYDKIRKCKKKELVKSIIHEIINIKSIKGILIIFNLITQFVLRKKTPIKEIINFIIDIKVKYNINLDIVIHDFFTICPTINLLDYQTKYCFIPDANICNICLKNYASKKIKYYRNQIKNDIINWRSNFKRLFAYVDNIIVPSKNVKMHLIKAYGDYIEGIITIREHNIVTKNEFINDLRQKSILHIAAIGSITQVQKGPIILKELIENSIKKGMKLKWYVIGEFKYDYLFSNEVLYVTGKYNHKDLFAIIKELDIDIFVFPSICPETYSYVLHEMILTSLPIVSFNIGAQSEFLSKYEKAYLVNDITSYCMFNTLETISSQYFNI